MSIHNPLCDGSHCRSASGEVRKLPYGSAGGNMILCLGCFNNEMAYRRYANSVNGHEGNGIKPYAVPQWSDLKVYEVERSIGFRRLPPMPPNLATDQSVMTVRRKVGRWDV